MSFFSHPRDEDRLCQVLRAYVEEWGPENVIVSVPAEWSEWATTSLGKVSLSFETYDVVAISVLDCDWRYEVRLSFNQEDISRYTQRPRIEKQSLEFCLYEVALRYLKKHERHGKKKLISRLLASETERPQNKLLLEHFEQKFGQTTSDEIAYWIIQHLIAHGLAAGPGHELFLTAEGSAWLAEAM